ncbi:hypothetical protein D9M70_641930 [compost metagenome]
MRHHRVVNQYDADSLAVLEAQRFSVGELHAVERPGELFHVASEVQFHGAAGVAAVRVCEGAAQVGIGQDATTIVTQAEARVIEFG